MATNNAINSSMPIAVSQGGTGLASTTANQLLYSSSNNVIAGLSSANSGVLKTSSGGIPSIDATNFSVLSTGVQLKGNNTNTTPPAGFLGQTARAYISNAASIPLTSATTVTITSINLTAGIWDISSLVGYVTDFLTHFQIAQTSISTTQSVIEGNFGNDSTNFKIGSAHDLGYQPVLTIPKLRVLLSSTTTYYLTANATFTTSVCQVYGRISATRVG